MKTILTSIIIICLTGCITKQQPVVEATKQWEGHYFTAEEFQKGTESLKLEKNESVWVLSDRTLARVLKKYAQLSEGK